MLRVTIAILLIEYSTYICGNINLKIVLTMRYFTSVDDIGPLDVAVKEALEVKRDRFAYSHLGRNKTLMMIFFNS